MKNVGLIGLGFIGKTHLEAYQHIENCQVTAICTRNKAAIPNHYNGSMVTDYEDLLNDKEIDIIDICLPTFLHEEFLIKAVNAGKHIICEKPLTLTLESANRIVDAVTKNNVRLFVAHVLRFWPEYKLIKSYSETNILIDIEIVHARRLGQAPAWSSWFQDPQKSGGALFDLHIHDIDFVYYLLGPVDTVYAVGTKNKYGAWDHVMTTLTFRNKCKAFIEASQRMPRGYPFTFDFRAQAGQGTVEFKVAAGENIENIHASNHQFIYYTNQKKSSIEIKKEDAFQNELAYFVNCVETNQENHVIPLDDVLYTLKLLKAVECSLETKQKVWVKM
ncbi:Gfo/Idh/MocA family oxidoreductase [Neobacillus novalis]|uniref:Gfo/Idh/MocA family oxidoreductase n=1 Tax=Neobacillus novalis TaxID=220687 RepID=A0AA95MHR4_9BACI|nr:Gfo/Idh/MocA family oxidoreductase [Neobacillus novalis]WHY83881.1 Gfo/Idh/MocA family oxidoreductase [Neobacillus novalis]